MGGLLLGSKAPGVRGLLVDVYELRGHPGRPANSLLLALLCRGSLEDRPLLVSWELGIGVWATWATTD